MKHSMTAVVALVLGLGVAATVNAQTTNNPNTAPDANRPAATTSTPPSDTTSTPPAAPAQPQMAPAPKMSPQASEANGPPQQMRTARKHTSRNEVEQAQRQLRLAGLYHGRIDGVDGRTTRIAIMRFQHRNGLPVTAMLTRTTLNRLMGSSTVGVGSSMPTHMTGRTHKMALPPTNAAGNAAGGNTAPNLQPNNQPNQQQ